MLMSSKDRLVSLPGDFRVSVWNVRAFPLWIAQCPDDVPQRQKATVDLNALLQSLSRVSRPQDALRSSQVDKVELGGQHLGSDTGSTAVESGASPTLVHIDGEDGVRSAGVGVHLGRSGMSRRVPRLQQTQHLIQTLDFALLHATQNWSDNRQTHAS